jgi:sialate O-acetylesterase
MKKLILVLSLLILGCKTQVEEVNLSLASLFQNHMVIQQDTLVTIWGWAREGVEVKLESSWGEKSITLSDSTGAWQLQIKTPKVDNTPHQIRVKAGKEIINISDVLLGEIWLASGQSNMEMPIKGFKYGNRRELIEGAEDEIALAKFPDIRIFTVHRNIAFESQKKVRGSWVVCSPKTVVDFSAVAYFFAKKLHQELNIPIGMIHSSWSGSPAESWARIDFLEKIEAFENTSQRLKIASDPKTHYNRWLSNRKYVERDSLIGVNSFKWIDESNKTFIINDFDDSSWPIVNTVETALAFEKNDFNGVGWIRQQIEIDEVPPGKLFFELGKTDDLYAIFVNGKKVGRKEDWGRASTRYSLEDGLLKKGKNTIAIRFIDVWGKGGFAADEMRGIYQDNQKIFSFAKDWKIKMVAYQTSGRFYKLSAGVDEIVKPSVDRMPRNPHSPSTLFNGMIAPLVPFALKGFIWYQGESNRSRAEQYKTLFPAVIDSWRSQWNKADLPFYYVQIAPFGSNVDGKNSEQQTAPELREAQMLTLSKPNVGMAVITDIGDEKLIHAPKKKPVGERLALWALAKDYGFEKLVHCGPIYKSVNFSKGRALIDFDHVGSGLYCPDKEIKHFEIAGEDGIYYPAKAKIKGRQISLVSQHVAQPKSVRFGWKNFVKINLFNKEDLPASSFRTLE